MSKINIAKLLDVKGFNPTEINLILKLIKKLLKESNIAITLNEERRIEKILNKISNNHITEEDLKFCKSLFNLNEEDHFLKNNDLILKLSKIIKNSRSSNINDEKLLILRESLLYKELKSDIIKSSSISKENNNYILTYYGDKNFPYKISFKVKFNDHKAVFSFLENHVNFNNFDEGNEVGKLFIEEIQIAMLLKLNIEFPKTYQDLISATEFIYFKHDKLTTNQDSIDNKFLNNIEIIRFNAQLKLVYNLEIKDPKIINLSKNNSKELVQKKIYKEKFNSYNFFKKIDNARKPCIPEIGFGL
jgi:hypothetical protein